MRTSGSGAKAFVVAAFRLGAQVGGEGPRYRLPRRKLERNARHRAERSRGVSLAPGPVGHDKTERSCGFNWPRGQLIAGGAARLFGLNWSRDEFVAAKPNSCSVLTGPGTSWSRQNRTVVRFQLAPGPVGHDKTERLFGLNWPRDELVPTKPNGRSVAAGPGASWWGAITAQSFGRPSRDQHRVPIRVEPVPLSNCLLVGGEHAPAAEVVRTGQRGDQEEEARSG